MFFYTLCPFLIDRHRVCVEKSFHILHIEYFIIVYEMPETITSVLDTYGEGVI